jgi:hypothetical protein
VAFLQQSLGWNVGQMLQVTFGGVQSVGTVISRHWPFWHCWLSGQQTVTPAEFVHTWFGLQQVPSDCTTVSSEQQATWLVPGIDWGCQGQHMRAVWGGVEARTTLAQVPLQQMFGDVGARGLYSLQMLACGAEMASSSRSNR